MPHECHKGLRAPARYVSVAPFRHTCQVLSRSTAASQLHAVDLDSVLDEEALKQGHLRDLQHLRRGMARVQVTRMLERFPEIGDLADRVLHPLEIAQVIRLDVEDAAG